MTITIKQRAALIRAARTAAQAFVGWLGQKWLASGDLTVSSLVHVVAVGADAAAGCAIVAAAAALGFNMARPVSPEA